MSLDLSKRLRVQTRKVVEFFDGRVKSLQDRRDLIPLFKNLDSKRCLEAARKIIGEGEWSAVGVDGSMDYDEHLDLLLFYVYATGYRCKFTVGREGVSMDVKGAVRDMQLSASAAIPLWMEDLLNVSQDVSVSFEYEVRRAAETIPISVMTMAEITLALKAVENPEVKLLLLDRPLSGTYPSLSKSLRTVLGRRSSALTGIETGRGRVTLLDLWVAGILGPGDLYVPPRYPYRAYAFVKALIEKRELSKDEACSILNVDENGLKKVLGYIRRRENELGGRVFEEHGDTLRVSEDILGYWDRVYEASTFVSDRMFKGVDYPLKIGDLWLTAQDINMVNLFLLYELIRRAKTHSVLLVGIAKDTEASEILRSVVPYMVHRGLIEPKSPIPAIRSNRGFLSLVSSLNYRLIGTPWRTPCYDSCFTTLVYTQSEGFKPARKVVSREALFIRVNFQLRSLKTDGAVRSMVFMYDRPFDPVYDRLGEPLKIPHSSELIVRPVFENPDGSLLDDLILYLLSLMDNPEVLEAYGYNQLLYLADKAVKTEVKLMKSSLRAVAELELAPLASRRRMFTFRSYRELRRILEASRRLGG
ncbi:MAG: hypothetical protein AYL29_015550 [Candidatus Bathyarchaeota archaeon B24]|nr:MAG: hypothetical protein AYL29_015550 [Candidatus Bathyarchaeota archaeon B24]